MMEAQLRRRRSVRDVRLLRLGGFLLASVGSVLGGDVAADSSDHALGSPVAPVTLIEYASKTCDNCLAFHRSVLPQILTKYVETGFVSYRYRDFPLDGTAIKAAVLPHCVARDRYFEAIDEIYRTTAQWIRPKETTKTLTEIGGTLGLDEQSVAACLADEGKQNIVLQSRLDATRDHNVKGTPTFVINGEIIEGILTLKEMTVHLDAALATARRKQ